ncbi:hypothetical protein ACNJQJ_22545, partial [Mycobacterium tuberculosis]
RLAGIVPPTVFSGSWEPSPSSADTLATAVNLPGPSPELRTVLLTGATGFLGRYLVLDRKSTHRNSSRHRRTSRRRRLWRAASALDDDDADKVE